MFVWHLWAIDINVYLTHWGRVTHICVSKLTIIGPDNGLSPGRRQAIIWTNAGILLIGPLGTNFSENLIGIQTFSFKKMPLKMASAKWRPFCLSLNVLMSHGNSWISMTERGQKTVKVDMKTTQTLLVQTAVYWDTDSLTENISSSYAGIINIYVVKGIEK